MSARRAIPVLVVLTALVLVALAAAGRPGSKEARVVDEIVLVARDMAYYSPGDQTPNPTVRVPTDRPVRLTLVNGDGGTIHDLAIETLGFTLGRVVEKDDSVSAILRPPRRPGTHAYVCTLHPVTMRGVLEVVSRGEPSVEPRSRARGDDRRSASLREEGASRPAL